MSGSKTIQLVNELKRIREKVPIRLDLDPVSRIPIFTDIAKKIVSSAPRQQSKLVRSVIEVALPKLTDIEQAAVKAQFGFMPGGETLSSAKRREISARCYHYSLSHFRQRGQEESLFISLAEALIMLSENPNSNNEQSDFLSPQPTVQGSAVVPRQLPPSASFLIGRSSFLADLDNSLVQLTNGDSKTASTTVISGAAGIGKTALALSWAHRYRDRFSDGDLFVNLHGYDSSRPANSTAVLELFLRSLGVVPEKIPESLEHRAALYRTIMFGKKMLVVLDNAASAQQVKPLLPATAQCLVIVTSRNSLSSLVMEDSARRIVLRRLTRDESVELLAQSIGRHRVRQESCEAEQLADLCDGLPLALTLVGEQVNSRPAATLGLLVQKLSSFETRFNVLEAPDDASYSVVSIFESSYHSLERKLSELFCLLSLHAGPTFVVESASVLADIPLIEADRSVHQLRTLHLIEEKKAGEFEFHDLLRDYARRVCQRDISVSSRKAAVQRELAWYLKCAVTASSWLMPHRETLRLPNVCSRSPSPEWATYDEALNWCEAQRVNLLHAVQQAFDNELDEIAWMLPVALRGFYNLRKHWSDWFSTHHVALQAVKRVGDLYAEGRVLNGLGTANFQVGRWEKARHYHELALDCRIRAEDWVGQGTSLSGLGKVYTSLGQHQKALDCNERSLEIRIKINDEFGQAWSLNGIGEVRTTQGNYPDAVQFFTRSLAMRRKVKDLWGEGLTLHNLGCAQRQLQRTTDARLAFEESLGIRRKIGDQWGVAMTLFELAEVYGTTNNHHEERACLQEALSIAELLKDPLASQIRRRMRVLSDADDQ